jgi:hypothetical protein
MKQTKTPSRHQEIIDRLAHLEQLVMQLLATDDDEPSYGSEEWWAWSIRKGEEAIENGDVVELKNEKDIERVFGI